MQHNQDYVDNPALFTVMPEMQNIANLCLKKYGHPIGSGRNRTVWRTSNGNVIKLPRNLLGCADNDWEGSVNGEYYPRSKLIFINGLQIAVAEYLEPAEVEDVKGIDWVGFVDSMQVGYDKHGVLKAYDYGVLKAYDYGVR